MKKRCENPNCISYKNYGGRSISVCDEWKSDFMSFYDWAITNGYEDGLEIDRKNNNEGYLPDNCHFVTKKENGNNRRTNHVISFRGETKTLAQWSEILELPYKPLELRLNKLKWSVERAFTTPIRTRRMKGGEMVG